MKSERSTLKEVCERLKVDPSLIDPERFFIEKL